MTNLHRTALLALLTPATAAGQANPFELTGGSVKSAYIVYETVGKPEQPGPAPAGPPTAEVGVTRDRWVMRVTAPFEMGGKKDTIETVIAISGDSQYTFSETGPDDREGEVSVVLRRHLAREYAALDAGGRSRFKENLKRLTRSSFSGSTGSTQMEYVTLLGEKKGSETIAGHKCDVYQHQKTTICVLPQAPGVILRSSDAESATTMVAKKVTLNGQVPTTASILPKGVRWTNQGYAHEEFAPALWGHKKQSDPSKVPPATMAKFAVEFLASPGAAAELKQMDPSMGFDESGSAEEAPGDENRE